MPNYGFVVTPQYNPMRYEDYIAPFREYATIYGQMADAYDKLEMEANQWEKLAQNAADKPQYDAYQKYATDLRSAAEELATSGLSSRTRSNLSGLYKRYAQEIKPIADAYALREEEQKMQRQAKLQHPDIMFSRDATSTGLGAYMAGLPELQSYNGENIYKYAASAAKNLAKEAREELLREGKKSGWYTILGDQYYEKAIKTGLTAEDVLSSMIEYNPETRTMGVKQGASPYLEKIVKDAVGISGMQNWSNWEEVAPRAYDYANMALWEALGQVDYKNLQNRNFEELSSNKQEDLLKYRRSVERTRQEVTNPNPGAVEKYRKIYKRFTTPLSDEVKEIRGVQSPSELLAAYTKYSNQATQRQNQLSAQLESLGITNATDKLLGSWNGPTIKLTESEEKNLIQQIRKQKGDYSSSDRIVKGYLEYTRAENALKAQKYNDNIDTIDELRRLQNTLDAWNEDIEDYILSDKEKATLESLGITEQQFYQNPLSAEDLLWEDTLTYLDATNEAGTTFRNDVLGGLRRNLLNKDDIEIREVRNKKGKSEKVKDKKVQDLLANDNIVSMMIDPITLKDNALTIQDKDGKFYSVPLKYLGTNVVEALNAPLFTVSDGEFIDEGTPNTSLLDAWKMCMQAKQYTLAHQIEVKIADAISGQFNYNFYQRQGNTSNEK